MPPLGTNKFTPIVPKTPSPKKPAPKAATPKVPAAAPAAAEDEGWPTPAEDDERVDADPIVRTVLDNSSTRELEDMLASGNLNATWTAAVRRELARRRGTPRAASGSEKSSGGLWLIIAVAILAAATRRRRR